MRKTVLLAALIILAAWGCRGDRGPGPAAKENKPGPAATAAASFVTAKEGRFTLAGKPYYFVGANFWQGMNLAVDGPSGDRARLLRELDRMRDLGLTNLRVMASSEGPNTEPFRTVPALMTAPGEYDGSVLDGLDFLLAEMGKRGMRAVMVLNNFWQWSGGMAQYVSWHEKTPIPYPGDYEKFINY
ncbi:MAG: mannanase, partial [Candidatus Aminicenantes bacterium RBG_16_66_30]